MATKNYTISFLILLLVVMICGFIFLNNKIQVSQHPTQDEWLEIYTAHNIHKSIDVWQQKVAVTVAIISKNADGKTLVPKQMIITMTSASGEDPISQDAKNVYIQTAERIAKSILEDYRLTKEYHLTIQYP